MLRNVRTLRERFLLENIRTFKCGKYRGDRVVYGNPNRQGTLPVVPTAINWLTSINEGGNSLNNSTFALAGADVFVKLASGKLSNSLGVLIFGTCTFLVGLTWVLTRFIDSGISVVTTITLFLIILIVY